MSSTVLRTFADNNKPIYLKCTADGIPELTYKWNNPNEYEVGDKSTYPLRNPGPAQFGNYACRVSKKLGAAQLLVEVKGIGMLLLLWL